MSRTGFGSPNFPQELKAEIQRLGGQASQASGRGYRFTSETGKAAGRAGGLARVRNFKARQLLEQSHA